MRFFDPGDSIMVTERKLPHWAQAGTVCFITWRTHDSMPAKILEQWFADRRVWLQARGIDPDDLTWKQRVMDLPPRDIGIP